MKHTIITLAMLMAAASMTPASAQKDYKFGNVTKAELENTTVPEVAKGAEAVVLNETVGVGLLNSCMSMSSTVNRYRFFRYILYSNMRKVKIMNPDASGTAKISVMLKNNETLDGRYLQVRHYSMRNGNITQKKYTRKNTEKTLLSNGDMQIDLIITDVKVRDIVEYCYTKVINLTKAETYDLQIQQNIPILNTKYTVYTEEPVDGDRSRFLGQYYKSITIMGKYPVVQSEKTTGNIYVPYEFIIYPITRAKHHYKSDYIEGYFAKNTYECYSSILTYEANNLPAITSESDNDIAKISIVFDPKEHEQFNSFIYETVVTE